MGRGNIPFHDCCYLDAYLRVGGVPCFFVKMGLLLLFTVSAGLSQHRKEEMQTVLLGRWEGGEMLP